MKKFNRLLSLVCLMSIFSFILPSSAMTENVKSEKEIVYITTTNNNYKDFEKQDPNTESFDILSKKVLLIDVEDINKLDSEFKKRYQEGLRTIIVGNSITKNDVRKFHGIKELPQSIDKKANNLNEGTQIAVVAYKYNGIDIIAGVKVIDESDREHALVHAANYDYSRILSSTIDNTMSLQSEGYSWNVADSDVNSISGNNIDLDASLQLYYDTSSPDSSGYYYYYTTLINESAGYDGASTVGMCRTSTYGTSQSSRILEYGHPNGSIADGNPVEFSLGYGIGGISYSADSKVTISKYSGGINSRDVEVRHQPKNALGVNSRTDFLRSELHYIARDKSTVYQANSAATAAAANTTIGVSLIASR